MMGCISNSTKTFKNADLSIVHSTIHYIDAFFPKHRKEHLINFTVHVKIYMLNRILTTFHQYENTLSIARIFCLKERKSLWQLYSLLIQITYYLYPISNPISQ